MAYNINDNNTRAIYQPGGTGIYTTGMTTQYVKNKSKDHRKVGR